MNADRFNLESVSKFSAPMGLLGNNQPLNALPPGKCSYKLAVAPQAPISPHRLLQQQKNSNEVSPMRKRIKKISFPRSRLWQWNETNTSHHKTNDSIAAPNAEDETVSKVLSEAVVPFTAIQALQSKMPGASGHNLRKFDTSNSQYSTEHYLSSSQKLCPSKLDIPSNILQPESNIQETCSINNFEEAFMKGLQNQTTNKLCDIKENDGLFTESKNSPSLTRLNSIKPGEGSSDSSIPSQGQRKTGNMKVLLKAKTVIARKVKATREKTQFNDFVLRPQAPPQKGQAQNVLSINGSVDIKNEEALDSNVKRTEEQSKGLSLQQQFDIDVLGYSKESVLRSPHKRNDDASLQRRKISSSRSASEVEGTQTQESQNRSVTSTQGGKFLLKNGDSSNRDIFWDIYKHPQRDLNCPHSCYIRNCEENCLLVLPLLSRTETTAKNETNLELKFDNYYFGDIRAKALASALPHVPMEVKKLSLKNVGIRSAGSEALIEGVSFNQLQHLSLAENRIGSKAAMQLFKIIMDPKSKLKSLDLSNNQLGDQAIKVLAQSLLNRCTIETLDISRNNIYTSAWNLGELLRIATPLKNLNASWNNIRGQPAIHFAHCMTENVTLTSLNIADNSLGSTTSCGRADIQLASSLAENKSLLHLDLSNNLIRSKTAIVLMHSLRMNKTLKSLRLRQNPIGQLGSSALLRAIASNSIRYCTVDIGDCNFELIDDDLEARIYGTGNFKLDLSLLADTILLKELVLLCLSNKAEIITAFHNNAQFEFNKNDDNCIFQCIPTTGQFHIRIELKYDRIDEQISSEGFSHLVTFLQTSFGESINADSEKYLLFCISVLAEEFLVSVHQAQTLLSLFTSTSCQIEKASAAAALIPQIAKQNAENKNISGLCVIDCASLCVPERFFEDLDNDGKIDVCGDICVTCGLSPVLTDVEQANVERKVGKWISFNPNNVTGRYRLHLTDPLDCRILMCLLETNSRELALRQKWKSMDTTQNGFASQAKQGGFRNARLNHIPIIFTADWQFPRRGFLEFDFVSVFRPPWVCTALNDLAFEQFLQEFRQISLRASSKLIGIRSISSKYYFSCSQVQQLMEQFGKFERLEESQELLRVEIFIALFSRIVDEWKIPETLTILDSTSKSYLHKRLGVLHCFHPLQGFETYTNLNITDYDNRQFVLLLVQLAANGEAELLNVELNNEFLETEEWKEWNSEDKLPTAGVVCVAVQMSSGNDGKISSNGSLSIPPDESSNLGLMCEGLSSIRKTLMQSLLLKLQRVDDEVNCYE